MKTKILLFIGLALSLISCSEDTLITYQGEPDNTSGIYFQRTYSYELGTPNMTYIDSASYTFAGVNDLIREVQVNVPVRTLGNVSNVDRPFLVEASTEEGFNAVENVDFTIDYDNCIVPAGQSTAVVPVTILRTAKLTSTIVRFKLTLKENEHFKLYIKEYKASNVWNRTDRMIDASSYVIRFTEQYTIPSYWTFAATYFGTWTPEKYKVVNDIAGWKPSDWRYAGMAGQKVTAGRFDYVARAVHNYLQEMADKGTPVKESDGTNMQLPDPYTVIYN